MIHYITRVMHWFAVDRKGGISLILDQHSTTPIYMQIASWLETKILKGDFIAGDKVYSQYQLADMLQINPATAAKGLTLLGQEGILYDKRGLGKFVSDDALTIIKSKRMNDVLGDYIKQIIDEAHHLQINETELLNMIQQKFRERSEGKKDD